MSYLRLTGTNSFVPLPRKQVTLTWPTANRHLHLHPELFFARTPVNADYGKPGWTRDCGKRFHLGCDIAPLVKRPDELTHTVMFSDCATGTEFPGHEPGWIPEDDIFAVGPGVVVEINSESSTSTLGKYVIIEHRWPECGEAFYSLYAHMDEVGVTTGSVVNPGNVIGRMGRTSSSADAREWMAIAPHLHLEFWNDNGESYDPAEMLRRFIAVA